LPNESVNQILRFIIGVNPFDITVNRLILIVVALVSLAGTIWFLSGSLLPNSRNLQAKELLPHLVLPTFTSVTLAYTLSQMVRTPWWWVVFLIGLVLVATVMISEQVDFNNLDNQSPIPMVSLTSLSIGLFLLGLIVLRTIGPRLYVFVPVVALASGFVSLRFIGLRTHSKPSWEVIIVIVLILAQLSAALYYIFINALQFGIILTGIFYILLTLSMGFQNNKKGQELLVEPLSMLIITIILTSSTFLF